MNNSNDTTTADTGIRPRTPKDGVLDWLGFAKFATVIWGLIGVITGLALCLHDERLDSWDDPTYPYLGYGIGVIATAVFSFIVTMAVLVALSFMVKEVE